MKNKPKYEYLLHTWGYFFSKEHKEKHGFEEGYHYFNTKEERSEYLARLRGVSEKLNANMLCAVEEEGYHVREEVVCHRVTEHRGKRYYSERRLPPGFTYSSALYIMEFKWYLGFNDYPMGEEFDYDNEEFEVIQEWVSGAISSANTEVRRERSELS